MDDNFYFNSMKKPFYKFCKHKSISYTELHLEANIDYCIELNAKRKYEDKIPEDVIYKIFKNFQWESFDKSLVFKIPIEGINSLQNLNLDEVLTEISKKREIISRNHIKDKKIRKKTKQNNFFRNFRIISKKGNR